MTRRAHRPEGSPDAVTRARALLETLTGREALELATPSERDEVAAAVGHPIAPGIQTPPERVNYARLRSELRRWLILHEPRAPRREPVAAPTPYDRVTAYDAYGDGWKGRAMAGEWE